MFFRFRICETEALLPTWTWLSVVRTREWSVPRQDGLVLSTSGLPGWCRSVTSTSKFTDDRKPKQCFKISFLLTTTPSPFGGDSSRYRSTCQSSPMERLVQSSDLFPSSYILCDRWSRKTQEFSELKPPTFGVLVLFKVSKYLLEWNKDNDKSTSVVPFLYWTTGQRSREKHLNKWFLNSDSNSEMSNGRLNVSFDVFMRCGILCEV